MIDQMNNGSDDIQKHVKSLNKELRDEKEQNLILTEKVKGLNEIADDNNRMKKEIKKLIAIEVK